MAKKKVVDEPVVLEPVTDEPLEPIHVPDEPAPDEPVEPAPKKAKKYEYVLDQPLTLVPLIADAWNEAKGKGDAAFADCHPSFHATLHAHAIDTLKSNKALQQDGPLADFEKNILAKTKE